MISIHAILIPFFFILGSCVGSFLNVVVWRLPRIEYPERAGWIATFRRTLEGLSNPPSHCPKCNQRIRWYDNIPVLGWIKLGGKCRFCKNAISIRYPIVEAATGLLFAFYYVMYFVAQVGPCAAAPILVPHPLLGTELLIPRPLMFQFDWPIYLLDMGLIACLLAASLIDAELFIIPIEIPWVMAAGGIIVHTIIDNPAVPGALNASAVAGALAAGGGIGLLLSMVLLRLGILPQSFPDEEPMLDVNPNALLESKKPTEGAHSAGAQTQLIEPPAYTRLQLYTEIAREMLFLIPPLVLAIAWWLVTSKIPAATSWWEHAMRANWLSGLLGAVLGALIGALVVWVTRILGTIAFGRLAMGLGDVHLMFGVGAIIGAPGATIAFFIAPFFGIATALYLWFSGTRRELPYGPYLSMASAFVLLFSCPIIAWLTPGMQGLRFAAGMNGGG